MTGTFTPVILASLDSKTLIFVPDFDEVPANLILGYYTDFVWYFGSQLYPVFLFLAVIFFTSKLANNTEITAILSSGLSFRRFALPYFISASVIVLLALFSGMFIVPKSNQNFNEFISEYVKRENKRNTSRIFKQINEREYIYASSYDPSRKRALNFSLENFEGNILKH